jgi:transcriptional regulator with XRE-family HTH domain
MKDELQEFSAQWVKKLRHQSGYTQEQFARAIGATSVTISRWERGIEPPSSRFRNKLLELSRGQAEKRMLNQLPKEEILLDPGIPFHSGLPAKGLIGRAVLLEKCKRWLQSHTGTLVLQGTYGVGKTSLASLVFLPAKWQD